MESVCGSGHPAWGIAERGHSQCEKHPPDNTARVLRLDSKSQSRQPTVTERLRVENSVVQLKGRRAIWVLEETLERLSQFLEAPKAYADLSSPPYGKPDLQCPLKQNYSANHSVDAQEKTISPFLLFFISGFQAVKPSIHARVQVPFSIKGYSRRQCRLIATLARPVFQCNSAFKASLWSQVFNQSHNCCWSGGRFWDLRGRGSHAE